MSLNKSYTVAVVHLVWLPFGLDTFKAFLDSYLEHNSGHEHELILLFNGVRSESDISPFLDLLRSTGICYVSLSRPGGQDLEAYFWLLPQLKHKYVLFLNSYCIFLAPNWLHYYVASITADHVGLVGASGTYHSFFTAINAENAFRWHKGQPFQTNFRRLKLLLKNNLLYRFYFKPFPNPHIRTNAFIIDREVMLHMRFKRPRNKVDAYRFESGRQSMTVQVLKQGLTAMVIDRFGRQYPVEKWFESNTFWTDDQKNLLISDNQTRKYENANASEKRYYQKLAWGK